MYKEVPGLVLYRDLGQDSILYCMADIFEAWEKKTSTKEELVTRIYPVSYTHLTLPTTMV